MKIRLVIIEADEVNAEDVRELLERTVSPARAQLAAAAPAAASHLPPSVPTAIVKSKPGWRAGAGRPRKTPDAPPSSARPETSMLIQCSKCGGELPEGKDRRSPCQKCGCKAWEKIPARHSTPTLDSQDDE
jgi:hypothetical protein